MVHVWTATDGSDVVQDADFGHSVALCCDKKLLIVGAPYTNVGGFENSGSVFVFARDDAMNWTQTQMLTSSQPGNNHLFGWSVSLPDYMDPFDSIDRVVVAVGSPGSHEGIGGVFLYSLDGDTLSEEAVLVPTDGSPNDSFGWSTGVVMDGVVVGAPNAVQNQGAAYYFSYINNQYTQAQTIYANNATTGDLFGWSVSARKWKSNGKIYGKVLIGSGGRNEAHLYYFDRVDDTWKNSVMLHPSGVQNNGFGRSVDEDSTGVSHFLSVGAPLKDDSRGGVYLLRV